MALPSTILCVDDDDDDLFFLREAIQSHGHPFHIAEAKNGEEAMAFLETALKKEELPCLVIMDMNMPKMDGRETISRIRGHEALCAIPVAVFTTSSNLKDKEYFENRGVHFLTKPFDHPTFTSRILELLASSIRFGN